MILADSSVWIQLFRSGESTLEGLLDRGEVLMHPDIIGELACGNLSERARVLEKLEELPKAVVASDEEVLYLIESQKLYGLGLGWVDAQLLAAALVGAVPIYTLDKPLAKAAARLNIGYRARGSA